MGVALMLIVIVTVVVKVYRAVLRQPPGRSGI
jgi:hypothetical protein